jgi:hypothetical protein
MLFNLIENLRLLKWRAKVRKSIPGYQGFLIVLTRNGVKSSQKWPKIN